jgi:uncharacterized repeat protein (TIGR03806 family)
MTLLRFFSRKGLSVILITLLSCGSSGTQNPHATPEPCVAFDPAVTSTVTLVNAFSNLRFDKPVALLSHPFEENRWYVVEQGGTVRTFSGENPTSSDIFIDISDRVVSGGEAGLLGMAFHPDFTTNRLVYLSYTGPGSPLTSHVSSFAADDARTADPQSETVLLNIAQPYGNHNGGGIAFGLDGFLYVGFGDGGSGGDPQSNGQNLRTLLGAMLRLDVNRNDTMRGTPYAVPSGNPFSSSLNCASGSGCPEIYAYGLRNPWRWSFDRDTGDLWVGDVGQNAWEEINRLEAGGNYGWNTMEGNHCYNASNCDQSDLILPVAEYGHDRGNSVTGGYVYRGSAMSHLLGDYIFGDFGSGRIWHIIDAAQNGTQVKELISSGLNISSFAEGLDGELYAVSFGDGQIYRLTPENPAASNIPRRLSETGYFQPKDLKQPIDCFIPYRVNAPFWSDNARKERWLGLPAKAAINIADNANWRFPVGSVLIKSFRLNGRLIETRLLIHHVNGRWAGYSYEWNADQTDAVLTTGKTVEISGRNWIFPGRSDCLQCHTAAAGRSLGLETAQLNGPQTYPSSGTTKNQLTFLNDNKLLTPPLAGNPGASPSLPDPMDESATLAQRARAYLHTNCAQCHRPTGPTPVSMDLRYNTPLAAMDIYDAPVGNTDLGMDAARLLAPGDPNRSILLQRMRRRDSFAMPPLASSLVDEAGAQLLQSWISRQTTCD